MNNINKEMGAGDVQIFEILEGIIKDGKTIPSKLKIDGRIWIPFEIDIKNLYYDHEIRRNEIKQVINNMGLSNLNRDAIAKKYNVSLMQISKDIKFIKNEPNINENNITKFCYTCRTTKPINEFYIDNTKSDGHCSKCKSCEKIYRDEYNKTKAPNLKKICPKCGIEKRLYEFYQHKKRYDGHQAYCKSCSKGYDSKYQKEKRNRLQPKNEIIIDKQSSVDDNKFSDSTIPLTSPNNIDNKIADSVISSEKRHFFRWR
jgi:hypothetical protein